MFGTSELLFVAFLLVSLYCFIRPPQWLQSYRKRTFVAEEGGIFQGTDITNHVRLVGKQLIKQNNLEHLNIKFHVLRSWVPNGHALPTGEIYLTRGIFGIVDNDDELAAVLAHEIGHVAAQHSVKRTRHAAKLMLLSAALPVGLLGKASDFIVKGVSSAHSQEHELEADALSVEYLHKAGYDPMAAYSSLRKLYELIGTDEEETNPFHEFLASHPVSEVRLNTVLALAKGY